MNNNKGKNVFRDLNRSLLLSLQGGNTWKNKGTPKEFDEAAGKWVENFNANNGTGCGNAYTDDAAFVMFHFGGIGKHAIFNGKEKITGMWEGLTKDHKKIGVHNTNTKTRKEGGLQVKLSNTEIAQHFGSFQFKDASGKTSFKGGILVELWRKQQDNSWKVWRDITVVNGQAKVADSSTLVAGDPPLTRAGR